MGSLSRGRSAALLFGSLLPVFVASLLPAATTQKVPAPHGQRLFVAKCGKCHGDRGQGGTAYPKPLAGT
ncbi:MAG TPA: c-type cytochrome, partial [Fimbriimonas sp.]|nr:c-type cytochrome [Fimbriimonas sp.]